MTRPNGGKIYPNFTLKISLKLFSLDTLPQNHRETGWVLNQLARCQFDQQKYLPAIEIYRKIQIIEPYRLSGLEYYSTCLFYTKDTTALSGL